MTSPPDDIPTQVNIRMPWQFHQFLKDLSRSEKKSVNKLIMEALQQTYGAKFSKATKATR